jgi:hypothetical protein
MSRALFVAVGQNGTRLVSEDGASWTVSASGKEGETFRAVCVAGGTCVAVGSYGGGNIIAATRDGAAWKAVSKDGKYSRYLRGVGAGGGRFVGIGGDPGSVGSSKAFVLLSADGLEWGEMIDIPGKHILRRLAFGNGVFVGVGDRGRRAVSRDGKEWSDAPEAKAIDTLVDVAFGPVGGGVFVGVGLHGLRMSSRDGLKWESRQVGDEGEHLNSVVWARDRFVAVGMGATYFSPDGVAWTKKPNSDAPLTAAHGEVGGRSVFVGAKWKGRMVRSEDAVAWKEVFKTDNHPEAVAWGPVG